MVSTVRACTNRRLTSTNGSPTFRAAFRKAANGSVSMAALLSAKQLVSDAGSVEAARPTLATLAKLL